MGEDKGLYHLREQAVPETPQPGQDPEPWSNTAIIGSPRSRIDAYERVSGSAIHPSDFSLPNMLHAAILRCPHAHARVRDVNTEPALRLPGTRAVLDANSLKANIIWPYSMGRVSTLFAPHCRFEGEAVAAVAADSPYLAQDALAAIEVEYEVLEHVVDAQTATGPDAVKIHDQGNIVGRDDYERGDITRGFADAHLVKDMSFHTACEIHTPTEPHGCVANWDGDRLTIWESTQGVYAIQSRVAEILGLPLAKVRVIGHYMGGGFGSKLQAGKYTVIAALLARPALYPQIAAA